MRRALPWAVLLPLTASGVLVAHAAAYEAVGAPSEGVHAYLAHAPQLVAVLVTLALAAVALQSRARSLSAWPFPLVAVAGFVGQEHVERLAHTGELPWLLTRPVFLVGLALQLPVALAAWLLARYLLRDETCAARSGPPRLPRLLLAAPEPFSVPALTPPTVRPSVRGPPAAL